LTVTFSAANAPGAETNRAKASISNLERMVLFLLMKEPGNLD
jgi:hypothetical protein